MGCIRIVFCLGLLLFGAVGAFMGAAVLITSLRSGEIRYSYGSGPEPLSRTVTHVGEPDDYWRLVAMMGGVPLVSGGIAVWYGRRRFKSFGR